jgi:hypothetical protein
MMAGVLDDDADLLRRGHTLHLDQEQTEERRREKQTIRSVTVKARD